MQGTVDLIDFISKAIQQELEKEKEKDQEITQRSASTG